jgi:hypothetical protein
MFCGNCGSKINSDVENSKGNALDATLYKLLDEDFLYIREDGSKCYADRGKATRFYRKRTGKSEKEADYYISRLIYFRDNKDLTEEGWQELYGEIEFFNEEEKRNSWKTWVWIIIFLGLIILNIKECVL